MTMATFTKLLVIKMVAKSFLGRSRSEIMRSPLLFFRFCISIRLLGSMEKKAISEPEIRAEHINRIAVAAMAIETPKKSELTES